MTPTFTYGQLVSPPTQAHSQTPNNIKTVTDTNTIMPELANAYAMVDRFLRENLGDSDYADYSVALEMIRTGNSPAPAPVFAAIQQDTVRWQGEQSQLIYKNEDQK